MSSYVALLTVHVIGACIWTGGHLVLAVAVLPRALRERSAEIVLDFERGYERIGLPALVAQVVTGLWLAYLRLGPVSGWLEPDPLARAFQIKLGLLLATVALALHARLRVIPRLRDEIHLRQAFGGQALPMLAAHIVVVTVLAVLFVLVGVSFRVGGLD